jgi:hypothetical protein
MHIDLGRRFPKGAKASIAAASGPDEIDYRQLP